MRDCLVAEAHQKQILHAHGLWRMPNVYTVHARRDTAARVVISPRGMLEPYALNHHAAPKRLFWWTTQRRALERADCLHATSEQEYESIRRVGMTNPVAVIGNGVWLEPVQKALPREREVLIVARLHPIKAIDRLLHAWGHVQGAFPSWRLRIVGPDSDGYLDTLKRLSQELRLERVDFGGAAFDAEKEELFSRASVFVLPSHSENFGLTIAEALSYGLPVIASRGTPWQRLETRGCGWWVSNDVPSLAKALQAALATDPAVLSQMGEKGRRWMSEEFGWNRKAAEMEAVYGWLSQIAAVPSTVRLA
jgi:glycosyltransferase involved in cell wall biosynthesis